MNNPLALNREEVAVGAVFGLSLAFFIGWVAVVPLLACAWLWALGGSGAGKRYRRFGVPIAAFLSMFHLARQISDIFVMVGMTVAAILVCSIGYGTPSTQPPDEGSVLGRFFFLFVKDPAATYLTRGVISALLAAAYLPFALIDPHAYIGFVFVLVVGQQLAVRLVKGIFYL